MKKAQYTTICKLHYGCSDMRCLRSFLDRLRPSDTDAPRNPPDHLQVTVSLHFKKTTIQTLR